MTPLGLLLARAASSLPNPTSAQQEILGKLDDLMARLEKGLLRVAVLGQFKRGKSTLLNALLGAPILPTGVTPVTAIPTFIKSGTKTQAQIVFNGGKQPLLNVAGADIPKILEHYISETQNPRNRFDVQSVEIELRSDFLDQGIVLIDTPGVGSTFLHNTRAAEEVLSECDAAIFVVSVDPPVTEVEATYLEQVQKLIPKIFFALNKIDLFNPREQNAAKNFLANVLEEYDFLAKPIRIFCVSAKQGLEAKQNGDVTALAASGVTALELVLAEELAREKHAIVFASGRLRSISLVGELLFQCELAHKALLTPQQDLERKAEVFEGSAAGFESQRRALSDFLSVDKKGLLKELDTETDRIWKAAQKEMRELVGAITARDFDEKEARNEITAALSRYFEQALRDIVHLFRTKLTARLAVHQDRAEALIDLVRQTAAKLMEISVDLPRHAEAFETKREPYWAAPAPSVSLHAISANALARFLPSAIREGRRRRQLMADAEMAALSNVSHLDWAIRQNIEDAFRRFEFSLSEQLDRALSATRQAMQLALQRGQARTEEIEADVKESAHAIAALSDVLTELKALES